MSSSVPISPNDLPLPYTAESAEAHCVALALHLFGAAAAYLVYATPGQLTRQWTALRQPNEPDTLWHIPSWARQFGDEALIVIPDTLADARIAEQLHNGQAGFIRSAIRMRIPIQQQLSGTLWVFDTVPRDYTADDLAALGHLLQIMAAASAPVTVLPPTSRPDESNAWLRALLQNATDLVAINDAFGVIQYISPSVTRILGYHPDDMIGRSSFDFVHPEDVAAVIASAGEKTKRPGSHKPVHMRFRDIHGRWRILEASSTNMLSDPHVQGMVMNAHDITDHIHAVDRLRMNDTTLQAISQGVIMTGPDRRIMYVNDAFTSITGYHQLEIQGQSCRFLQGPLTNLSVAADIRMVLDAGAEYAGEILNYRKDGTTFWNDLTITPVLDEHGQVTNFVGIVHDITERKQAQSALITNETRLRTIIDASPVPMGLNDEQQRITFLNPAFTQTFGYTNDELPTLTQWWEAAYPDSHYRQWVIETWHAELERMQRFSDTFSPCLK